jgi:hypothetical protein
VSRAADLWRTRPRVAIGMLKKYATAGVLSADNNGGWRMECCRAVFEDRKCDTGEIGDGGGVIHHHTRSIPHRERHLITSFVHCDFIDVAVGLDLRSRRNFRSWSTAVIDRSRMLRILPTLGVTPIREPTTSDRLGES